MTVPVELRIKRFDPERDEGPHWETYQVEVEEMDRVLDALHEVRWHQDGSLAFRRSCAHGVCGSDAMVINGENRLACVLLVQDVGATITVEPLRGLPVVKDLVVDMDAVHWKKVQRVVPWLLPDGEPPEREYVVPPESMIDITQSMACIHCGVCVSACLSLEVDPDFVGPAALAKAYRFVADPRDAQEEERLRDLAEDPHGIYDCTHCFACIEVCPKDVDPMNQIMRLRRRATADYGIEDANNGYGHENAFTRIIERYGTLHEAQLLPRSFGDGSLVKGQTEPGAVKQLAENLPTALRGLKAGKVTPRKVLLHPKLPDQRRVRRIFKEIHSKDERLELNLYIVGEDGDAEEGAMAEGSQEG